MLLKLHRRLQLFVIAFALFNVALCVDYDTPVDPLDVADWANMDENNDEDLFNEDKRPFHTYKSEELAIFSHKSDENYRLYSCIKFADNHFCKTPVLKWPKLHHKVYGYLRDYDFSYDIRRIEIASAVTFGEEERHFIDIRTYRTPYVTFRITGDDFNHLSFGFVRSIPLPPADQLFIRHVKNVYFFEDPSNHCTHFLPDKDVELTGVNAMKTAFYYRYKGKDFTTYAYFFVKGPQKVCWYRFEVNDLGKHGNKFEIEDKGMIKYPSKDYAPHFFAFDQNLGAFVSLYWTGRREQPPYVHFHIFDENEPALLNYDGGYALNGFDKDVLVDIFKGDYDADAYPAFVSFGQQVFISFTRKGASHEYSGLWSGYNGTPHFEVRRPLDDYQTLVRLRKDYISVTDPKRPYIPDYKPDPNATTRNFIPDNTELTTKSPSISNHPDIQGHAAGGDNSQNNAKKDDCIQVPPLWLMILFIVLDILLLIILIVLIILTRFGAKKRNAKPAKGKKAKVAPVKAAVSPAAPNAGTPTTESKKSIIKGKPGNAVKDKKTADGTKYYTVKNKNKTVEQGTQFFTVDTTFDHTVEKKGTKKK